MPEVVRLELGPGLRVEWELATLMRAADSADPSGPTGWSAEVEWSGLESLRLISCAAGEEAMAIAVARPRGAEHHDADLLAGVRAGAAGVEGAEEVLLSTEYDPDGQVRRIGVELWLAGGSATRVAADRSGEGVASSLEGLVREATPMSFRLGGAGGAGLHELIHP